MNTTPKITQEEWIELAALKAAINVNPASVHPDRMEKFTELFVKTLPRIDYDDNQMVTDATDSH
jgi:hypothetical protein